MNTRSHRALRRWRLGLAAIAACCTVALAQATKAPEPLPEPTPDLVKAHEVWLDEVPASIQPSDIEVVVLSADSQCKPVPQKGLFGIQVMVENPLAMAFCRRLMRFVEAPVPPLPLAVRLHTGPSSRDPAAVLANLDPPAQGRYVALVQWRSSSLERQYYWEFETVLLERATGRWLWHGAHHHDVSPLPDWREQTELRTLNALLRHELPLPGAVWIPVRQQDVYGPGPGRAGLVIINAYASMTPTMDRRTLKIWPAGTSEIDDTAILRAGDWSQFTTVRRAQSSPILAPFTHALLDLPAGPYQISVSRDAEPLQLEPGKITVLRIERGLLNVVSAAVDVEPAAGWRKEVQAGRLRHGFLAEPPSRYRQQVVPYFMAPKR